MKQIVIVILMINDPLPKHIAKAYAHGLDTAIGWLLGKLCCSGNS